MTALSQRLTLAATAFVMLATACSSAVQHGRTANAPATTSSPPAQVGISASTETWTLPAAVSRPVVLPDRSAFVELGGLATGDTSTSRVVRVDPASGHCDVAGTLAIAVHDSAGAAIDGRFFVFGGGSASTVSVVQAWTAGPAAEVARLPQGRS